MPWHGPVDHAPGKGRRPIQAPEQHQRDDHAPWQGGQDQGQPAPGAEQARQPGEEAGQGQETAGGHGPGRGLRQGRPRWTAPCQDVGEAPAPGVLWWRHAELVGQQHCEIGQGGIQASAGRDTGSHDTGPHQAHRLLCAAMPSARPGQVAVVREHRHRGSRRGDAIQGREQPVAFLGRHAVRGRGGSFPVARVVHGQVVHEHQVSAGSPGGERRGLQAPAGSRHRREGERARDLFVVLHNGHGLATSRPRGPGQGGQGRALQPPDRELHP